jgi:cytochrome b
MLLGLVLALVVCLRIVWGFVGSRYARFSSFTLKPRALFQYFGELITGKAARTLGHNPASSWAAIIMMALSLGLALTGYLMTAGNKETFEDAHELLANTFLIVAITHVAGVILHSLRHKDRIGLSMVNGKKHVVEGQPGIDRSYRGVALLFLAIVGAFVFHLGRNYDASTQTLHLFGKTLQLGESEGQGDHKSSEGNATKTGHDGDEN